VNESGDFLEDFIELKNMEKLDFLLDEMETLMDFEFNHLLEMEDFDN